MAQTPQEHEAREMPNYFKYCSLSVLERKMGTNFLAGPVAIGQGLMVLN